MAKQQGFSVRLSGSGLNLNQKVSAEMANAIVALVLGGKPPAPPRIEGGTEQHSGAGELKSVREFLDEHEPKRAPDQIATFALYLRTHKNAPKFTKQQMVQCFEDALEPVPGNLNRDLKWTGQIGWIAPKSGEKDTYYLTATGEKAAKGHFSLEVRKKTKIKRTKRKGKKAKATIA